mmetsp:Transcript_16044/g.64788  ORF Transcript_16044/g.64788 Transcript_16044/m.64788 type:complete len:345 (+) Transcript_16044:341-1375(+)
MDCHPPYNNKRTGAVSGCRCRRPAPRVEVLRREGVVEGGVRVRVQEVERRPAERRRRFVVLEPDPAAFVAQPDDDRETAARVALELGRRRVALGLGVVQQHAVELVDDGSVPQPRVTLERRDGAEWVAVVGGDVVVVVGLPVLGKRRRRVAAAAQCGPRRWSSPVVVVVVVVVVAERRLVRGHGEHGDGERFDFAERRRHVAARGRRDGAREASQVLGDLRGRRRRRSARRVRHHLGSAARRRGLLGRRRRRIAVAHERAADARAGAHEARRRRRRRRRAALRAGARRRRRGAVPVLRAGRRHARRAAAARRARRRPTRGRGRRGVVGAPRAARAVPAREDHRA